MARKTWIVAVLGMTVLGITNVSRADTDPGCHLDNEAIVRCDGGNERPCSEDPEQEQCQYTGVVEFPIPYFIDHGTGESGGSGPPIPVGFTVCTLTLGTTCMAGIEGEGPNGAFLLETGYAWEGLPNENGRIGVLTLWFCSSETHVGCSQDIDFAGSFDRDATVLPEAPDGDTWTRVCPIVNGTHPVGCVKIGLGA